jgi:hypothetical protein
MVYRNNEATQMKKYEIVFSDSDILSRKSISDEDRKELVWILYRLGYSAYETIDGDVAITATEEDVTELSGADNKGLRFD